MKHPFKPLGLKEDPAAAYDAVIVGAGVGGLVLANLLAREGMQVLLLEQHYVVGGYCSSFQRKGYCFDAGSHFYPLLGNPNSMTGKLIADIGVTNPWIQMDPVDHFHLPGGECFSVPVDFDAYLAKLKQRFPVASDALDQFFKEVRGAYMYGLLEFFKGKHAAQIEKYLNWSVQDVLDRHFTDPELKLLLAADCAHWGAPPSRTSFVFDSMLRLSYFLGNYYPKGSSQRFVDELALRFQEAGGTIALRASVERIEIDANRVQGVRFAYGVLSRRRSVSVAAPIVISNADMLQTYNKLLDPLWVAPERLSVLRSMRKTYPCYLMHLGIRGMSADVLDRAQGYYWDSHDLDAVGADALKFKLFVPSLYDPDVAPADCHVMLVQKIVAESHDAITNWPEHKARVEHRLKTSLNQVVPGLLDRAEVCLTASAMTSHRYTLNSDGAMLGWEMSPDQVGRDRPGIESEVEGLYFVGHWTQPGGGITPVIMSSVQVAERILDKKVAY